MPRHRSAGRPFAFLRVRAVLAGALVLGVGATLTLASWTDHEYEQAAFSTSKFDTESSVNGGTSWADNSASPGATITFDASAMSPSSVKYAAVLIRTKTGSLAGNLVVSGAAYSPSGTDEATVLGAALRYRVIVTTATCAAGLFTAGATYVVGSFAAPAMLGTTGSSTSVAANGTANTGLCFEVSLPSTAANTLQGLTSTVIWHVVATSVG